MTKRIYTFFYFFSVCFHPHRLYLSLYSYSVVLGSHSPSFSIFSTSLMLSLCVHLLFLLFLFIFTLSLLSLTLSPYSSISLLHFMLRSFPSLVPLPFYSYPLSSYCLSAYLPISLLLSPFSPSLNSSFLFISCLPLLSLINSPYSAASLLPCV